MKINYAKVYVNDQEKALQFYTEKLGFTKKDDVTSGDYRWLALVSPEDKDGPALLLELNNNPAAKAYQKAMYEQQIDAISFTVSDLAAEYERLKALGVTFLQEPTNVYKDISIAILDDTCGNFVQLQTGPAA